MTDRREELGQYAWDQLHEAACRIAGAGVDTDLISNCMLGLGIERMVEKYGSRRIVLETVSRQLSKRLEQLGDGDEQRSLPVLQLSRRR
jgi:hypothetical protein